MHKEILDFIKVIRESFHDSVIVYRFGACYQFYKILKHIFPEARAYFDDEDKDHILTKIGGRFYEVKGEYLNPKKTTLLSKKDHERWEAMSFGQDTEYMVSKYRKTIKID